MHDPSMSSEPAESLAAQAFLYASGELEPEEARSFELRLGEDQAARDALCQAVGTSLVASDAGVRPDPAYRERVRARLCRPTLLVKMFPRRYYRGHPALWSGLGAAGALLVVAFFIPARTMGKRFQPVSTDLGAAPPAAVPGPVEPTRPASPTIDVAGLWAELPNGEHLLRARDEEARRRLRSEDLHRLSTEEQHSRPHPPLRY